MLPQWRDVRAAVLVAALGCVYATMVAFGVISHDVSALASNAALIFIPVLAGVTCFVAARRHDRRVARGWRLVGASAVAWGLGSAAYWYLDKIAHSAPFPSIADISYLASIPLAAAGFAHFVESPKRSFVHFRTLLDGALIGALVLFVSWAAVLESAVKHGTGSVFAQIIALAYPIGDVVVATTVIYLWMKAHREERSSFSSIGLALVALGLSDSVYVFVVQRDQYSTGHPVDAGWLAAYALVGVAALQSRRRIPSRDIVRPVTRLSYAIVLLTLLTTLVSVAHDREVSYIEMSMIAVVLALVVARMFVDVVTEQKRTIAEMRSVDEMKSGILYAVSHELRTPLTFIKGATEMLALVDLDESIRRDLTTRLDASFVRLESVVDSLVDVGRLSRGVVAPNRSRCDVRAIVAAVADDMMGGDHTIIVDDGVVVASVDAAQVERIVENLLKNAVRHTPPGTNIRGSVQRTGSGVLLSIDDDGPGVPIARRDEIFQPFTQEENLRDLNTGTGIGLALVRKFAELHGGRAWVEDAPSGGAGFRVFLADEPLAA